MTFFYWFTARSARDAKTAELNIISFAVERTAKEKNQSLRDIFLTINARRAWFSLFSVLSTENNKINNLSALCDSAVIINYQILMRFHFYKYNC
jgi:hypothetical protein